MNVITKKNNWLTLALTIVGVQLIGFLSSGLAGNIKAHYLELSLPPLAPPASVFGPVWAILYLMIAISGYLVIRDQYSNKLKFTAVLLFVIQLSLNFIWSIVFFGQSNYWLGAGVIVLLILSVTLCIVAFSQINRISALLMIPYLIWICFATYLTVGVAFLN